MTISENTWFPGHQTGGVRTPRDECFEVCGQGDRKFCIWGSENLVCKTVPDIPATGLAVCRCGADVRRAASVCCSRLK